MSVKKISSWLKGLKLSTLLTLGLLLTVGSFATLQNYSSSTVQADILIAQAAEQTPESTGNENTEEEQNPTCEENGGEGSWLICPVLRIMNDVVVWLDAQIAELLLLPEQYFTGNIEAAWARVRNLAFIVLVPIVLVMVISTALGFEFVSAYTVKRALPRLAIAVLFITLSWEITMFAVELTNVLGKGIGGLIAQPFGGLENLRLDNLFNSNGYGDGGFLVLLVGAGVAGSALASVGIVLSYAFVAFVALFLGFTLLAARQFFIIALMLVAPLAILAWIFPGNDKMWKLWSGGFIKLLMLYPLIMVAIVTGRVFAHIIQGTNQDGPTVTFVKLVAYFAPYFLIPTMFKFGGGLFATISGMVNDRERGLFDRQAKYRQEKASQNWSSFKAGDRFNERRGFGTAARGMNRVGIGLGVGAKNGFGFGERGSQAIDQTNRQNSVERVMKSPAWSAIENNDDALHAATYSSAYEAQRGLTERFRSKLADDVRNNKITAEQADAKASAQATKAVAAVNASTGFGQPQAIAAAQQLVSTGTGYDSMEDMTKTLARAAGGNANTVSSMAGFANAQTKKVGRNDLAPGFNKLNDLALRQAGLATDAAGQKLSAPDPANYASATLEAARTSGDTVTLLRGKEKGLKHMAEALHTDLKESKKIASDPTAKPEDRQAAVESMHRTLAEIEQLDTDRGFASSANQLVINQMISDTDKQRIRSEAIQTLQTEQGKQQYEYDKHRHMASRRMSPDDPRNPLGAAGPTADGEN